MVRVPDARLDMKRRYCSTVQRVSTSISIVFTYILTSDRIPGNSSCIQGLCGMKFY